MTLIEPTIAFYLQSLGGGGAERMMLAIANGVACRGRKVDLVLATNEGPYLSDVDPRVTIVDLGARGVLGSAPGLVRYLRDARPAVLISALSHANVVAVAARWISRVPVRLVISERASLTAVGQHHRNLKYRLIRAMMPFAYKKADAVTVVAEAMVDEFADTFKLHRSKIFSIPNPVVTPHLLELAKEEPSHPFARQSDVPLILGVGRLTAQKDFATLVKAFARLRQRRPAKLLILGEGDERPALESLVAASGLGDDVSLPGFCPNPFAIMRAASVFALSSRYEGLPGALVQAMAVGTAVVSTDCPTGPAEILEGGRWGKLVPVGEPEAMAEALLETLQDPSHPPVAKRAQHYNLDQAIDKYLAVLEPGSEWPD